MKPVETGFRQLIEQSKVGEMVFDRNELELSGPLERKRVEEQFVRATFRRALLL